MVGMTVMLSHVIKTKGSPLVKSLDTTMDVVFTALKLMIALIKEYSPKTTLLYQQKVDPKTSRTSQTL